MCCLQEYIVNLWTQDREMSQPWSMSTFQEHINNVTGSRAAYDSMWAHMQRIIGEHVPVVSGNNMHHIHMIVSSVETPVKG